MNADKRRCLRFITEAIYNSLPLDLGSVEVDKQADCSARGSQIVQALRRVLVAQGVGAFEFNDKYVFDENIGEVLPIPTSFVDHGQRCLTTSSNAAKVEFHDERPLVDFLEESSTQRIGDLKNSGDHTLSQRFQKSAFIGVHRRLFTCAARTQLFSVFNEGI